MKTRRSLLFRTSGWDERQQHLPHRMLDLPRLPPIAHPGRELNGQPQPRVSLFHQQRPGVEGHVAPSHTAVTVRPPTAGNSNVNGESASIGKHLVRQEDKLYTYLIVLADKVFSS